MVAYRVLLKSGMIYGTPKLHFLYKPKTGRSLYSKVYTKCGEKTSNRSDLSSGYKTTVNFKNVVLRQTRLRINCLSGLHWAATFLKAVTKKNIESIKCSVYKEIKTFWHHLRSESILFNFE